MTLMLFMEIFVLSLSGKSMIIENNT